MGQRMTTAVPGKTIQIPIRCDGEESLIRLLSQLEVIQLLVMLYEYGSAKSMRGRAYDAVIIVAGDDSSADR